MKYSPHEDSVIREMYPTEKTSDISQLLGRTPKAIRCRAEKLGVKKTEEYQRWRMLNWGDKTQFGKGRINKPAFGRKVPRLKVGAIRKAGNKGLLQVKTSCEFGGYKDWEFVHHIEWKKHNGEIPEKHAIQFKDGNQENTDISNLICVPKNKGLIDFNNRFPEISELNATIALLHREIGRIYGK